MRGLENISASTWPKVARSEGAGRSITSPGPASGRYGDAVRGTNIMHWPHAMQPNPWKGSMRISRRPRQEPRPGKIVAHSPQAVQVARLINGLACRVSKLPMVPIAGLPLVRQDGRTFFSSLYSHGTAIGSLGSFPQNLRCDPDAAPRTERPPRRSMIRFTILHGEFFTISE